MRLFVPPEKPEYVLRAVRRYTTPLVRRMSQMDWLVGRVLAAAHYAAMAQQATKPGSDAQ